LQEIAQATGGFYLHLGDGPRTMSQLYTQGLANMKAAEIDARLSRRPIERYEWPLGAAIVALTMSILIGERKKVRARARLPRWSKVVVPATALVFLMTRLAFASAPALDLYRDGKYNDAYQSFQEDLKAHPESSEKEKIEFDSGAAAFKMGDYNKALQSFSDALLSPDKRLQENSHFNLGRTLEDRADMDQTNDTTLKDLTDAASHYEATLELNPKNEAARANLEEVKKKIERLKQHPKQKPTPPPQPPQQQKKDQQGGGGGQSQDQQQQSQNGSGGKDQNQNQQQQQQNQQAQSQNQNQQQQNQSSADQKQNSKDQSNQQMAKNQPDKNQRQPKPGESPSPSQGADQQQQADQPSPSPGKGEDKSSQDRNQEPPEESPTPGSGEDQVPSPSPGTGEGEGENGTPSPTPAGSPQKKLAGEIKGKTGNKEPHSQQQEGAAFAGGEPETEGQMSEKQAELLLQSMKDEEARVQLDERRVRRRVYNDW
jgi:Ca-activated chloride channel family protein